MSLNSSRTDVKPLLEKDAVELGADLIGELIVYSIAAAILVRDYIESNTKAAAKESKLNSRLRVLEDHIDRLDEELRQARAGMGAGGAGRAGGVGQAARDQLGLAPLLAAYAADASAASVAPTVAATPPAAASTTPAPGAESAKSADAGKT